MVAAVWLSGNGARLTNEVNGCPVSIGMGEHLRAGIPPRYVTVHPGQLSLLPSARRIMNTSRSAVMLCCWGLKAGRITVFVYKRVGGR